MNFYQKIDQYLLRNYPLVWHSRFLFLMLSAIGINIVLFVIGYTSVNIDLITNENKGNWFMSYGLLTMILLGLICMAIWGLLYYRNLAAKKLYPIDNYYFHKLFILLSVSFFLFLFGYITFYFAADIKTKQLISEKEFHHIYDIANLSNPFLVFDALKYNYSFRKYPKVYQNLSYKFIDEDEIDNIQIMENNEIVTLDKAKHRPKIPKFTLSDGDKCVIYSENSKLITNPNDTCKEYEKYIDSFYSPTDLPDFVEYSVLNFSSITSHALFLDRKNRNDKTDEPYATEVMESENSQEDSYIYADLYAPRVHNWIKNHPDSVKLTLFEFAKILNKFKIKNNLKPDLTAKILYENQYKVTLNISYNGSSMRTVDKQNINNDIIPYDDTMPKSTEDIVEVFKKIDYPKGENDVNLYNYAIQYIDMSNLEMLISNLDQTYTTPQNYTTSKIYPLHIAAMALAFIFLFFEFADIKIFIFTIPVAGAITILAIQLSSFFEIFNINLGALIKIIIALGIVLATMVGLYDRQISKRVLRILYYMSYAIVPFWLIMLANYLHRVLSYTVNDPCDPTISITKSHFPDWLLGFSIMLSPYLMYALFLFTIKRFIAKEE